MRRIGVRSGVLLLLIVLAVGGLVWQRSRGDGAGAVDYCGPPERVHTSPDVAADDLEAEVSFEPVGAVEQAVGATGSPDGALFVVARGGEVWRLTDEAPAALVLDLSDEVATESLEQGLLGVAVAPDGAALYLHATLDDGTASVLEYQLDAAGVPQVDTRRDVLVLDDPAPTHNGGRIAFGPDGMLYVALGDGGDGAITGASQDLGSPFGKLLRIDPTPDGEDPYTIPADNPFVDVEGARAEVWASGFRNPWGWSFDRATGDLWVGDVGQLCFEEIDFAADGGRAVNFGWSHMEGAHAFAGPGLGKGGVPDPSIELPDLGDPPDDLVGPVLEYGHDPESCSVIGGFVYRGDRIPELRGTYLWADLCQRSIKTLRPGSDGWLQGELVGPTPAGIVAFTEGLDGELYAVSFSEGVFAVVPPE